MVRATTTKQVVPDPKAAGTASPAPAKRSAKAARPAGAAEGTATEEATNVAAAPAAFVPPNFGRSDAWWPPVESPAESPADGAEPGPLQEVHPASVPASPPSGPDAAAPGPSAKGGLPAPALAAIVLGSLGLIAFIAALLTVALLGTDDESVTTAPAQATAPASAPAPAPAPPPQAEAGAVPPAEDTPAPVSAAFATVPGFSFEGLPPALLSQLQSQFEAGLEQGLAGDPALAGVAAELVDGIEGRMVISEGETVAVAVAISVDPRWADLPGLTRAGVGGVGEALPPSAEQLTIAGQDAVFAETDGQSVMVSSRNGTLLFVSGISADRATLEQIMAELLANL